MAAMERLDGVADGEGDGSAPCDLDRGVKKNYNDVGNPGCALIYRNGVIYLFFPFCGKRDFDI